LRRLVLIFGEKNEGKRMGTAIKICKKISEMKSAITERNGEIDLRFVFEEIVSVKELTELIFYN
jgi:hypothetical protein